MVKITKLSRAQNTLWDLLSAEEKEQHAEAYKVARKNLENSIAETIIDYCKVVNNAPASTYFPVDHELPMQANIVGKVKKINGAIVIAFHTEDIKELLELYFGENIIKYN